MKERYFTKENIKEKSELLLGELRKSKKHKDIGFSAEKSALIIMDMQGYFLNPESHAYIPSSCAIIANIQDLIKFYKKANLPVIFTQHINTRLNANLMSEWWGDVITENNKLSEIQPEFELSNSVIIKKTQYDAFHETNLEELLNNHNVRQVVITGVMTHLCCETTVRSAFVKGFKPFIPIDATATYNEKFHKATFINLSHGFTSPIMTNELLEPQEKHR